MGVLLCLLTVLCTDMKVQAGEGFVAVRNRRGDLLCQKSGGTVTGDDMVCFFINGRMLMENEICAVAVSFDGGDNFGAPAEVEDNLFSLMPQQGSDIVVRFYVCSETDDEMSEREIKNPPGGEQIYTVRYASDQKSTILADFTGNFVKQAGAVSYYAGSAPQLKVYPSQAKTVYVTVDDGKDTKEFTVTDRTLVMKLSQGQYAVDVFSTGSGQRIHADGFPKTICYDASAPALPSFTVLLPTDGAYYPEGKKYQYYAAGSLNVRVSGTDQVSGVEHIYMKIGDGEPQETDFVQLMAPFTGAVYAKLVDKAGNATQWVRCAEQFVVESSAPRIEVSAQIRDQKVSVSGCVKDTSGIREVEVLCGEDRLFSYTADDSGEIKKEKEFSISKEVEKISYQEQNIRVRALDIAGNRGERKIAARRTDKTPPAISLEGCENFDVTSSDVRLRIQVSDDNLLEESIFAEAVVSGVDRKEPETIRLSFPETVLTKEGNYEITAGAEDTFGNKAVRKINFTIDKSAPQMDAIQEYDGRILREFTFSKEEGAFIRDLTGVSFRLYLNGRDFDGSRTVTEPGNYVLQAAAEDEAGNVTIQRAEFTIEKQGGGSAPEEPDSMSSEEPGSMSLAEPGNVSPAGPGTVSPADGTEDTGGKDRATGGGQDQKAKPQDTFSEQFAGTEKNQEHAVSPVFLGVLLFAFAAATASFVIYRIKGGNSAEIQPLGSLTQNTGCDRLNN